MSEEPIVRKVRERRGVYIVKSRTGPFGPEWVVRIAGGLGDMAICGCPSRFEAELVRQCLIEACGSRIPSVRLRRMMIEVGRHVGPRALPRPL